MMARCHALRKLPIGQLAPGDLRILIGQGIGIEYLMPLALELLFKNPLIEGDYYPGDLLSAAMSTDRAFWSLHSDERARLGQIAAKLRSELAATDEARRANRQLLKDVEAFVGHDDA
jgi:hypothetical protein